MRKKLLALGLCTSLCLAGCTNSPEEVVSPQVTAEEVVAEGENSITENVDITTADEAITRLKEGNQRFVNDASENVNVTSERREQLLEGQNPYAVVISCSDSRVTPTAVFNVGLGELFDVRIAGNVLDSDALGSIEYGVEHCEVPLVVVMGHESCGAVTAAYDILQNGTEVEGNINSLMDKILPNIQEATSLDDAIADNALAVKEQVEEDEIVKEYIEAGKVKVVLAHYSLDGKVTFEE